MDRSFHEGKSSFKILGLSFSSKFDWGSHIISIAKTASKKIGALVRSMKFLSPEVARHLYKSIIRSCMEYCCHVFAGAPRCFLELLDKLQKRIGRTVSPSLAAFLEHLAHRRNVSSLSFFYRIGICSSELAQLVLLPFVMGGLLIILIDCMLFLSPFLDVTRMCMSTASFLALVDSGELSAYRLLSFDL